jgi:flagellar hook-associated protein 2
MATISSAGLGSGLDVNSIITQLMAIERQPLAKLQSKQTTIQSTVSEYGKIKAAVSTLRDLSTKLASASHWGQTVAASSNPAAVAATTASGSAPGSYSVAVQALASVQTLASGMFASTAAMPGAGTLRIELGAWGAGQTAFTPQAGAAALDITVAATDTLAEVRDKINSAGAGVSALIMSDASGSRLLIRSNTSGAANAFRSTVTDADGVNNDAAGLSALAFDPSTASAVMTQTQAAANAAATIDGLAVISPSNSFANVIDGLTLTLGALTTSPVSVSVDSDKDALKKTMTEFAEAYSALVKMIATDTKYDAANKKGGLLQGDGAAVGLQRQLRALAGATSGASTSFTYLSDAGLQLQRDGSMTINATQLDNALAKLPELKKLFSNSSLTDPNVDGFAKRFRVVSDAMLAADGALATRTDGLGQQLQRNQKTQDGLSVRLAATEKRMRAQYTALDATMARLNSVSSFVTQQINAYNASGSRN